MKYLISFIMIVLLAGCDGSEPTAQTANTLSTNNVSGNLATQETNTTETNTNQAVQTDNTIPATANVQALPTTTEQVTPTKPIAPIVIVKKPPRTLTVYIHGYSKSGTKRNDVYGNDNYDPVIDAIVETTGFDTSTTYNKNSQNIIAITPYYGNIPPSYYTPRDEQDIKDIGEGIPRYALIIAKFTKHMMKLTQTDKVNFMSVSMGSLVTRYLIEKDLENLSSTNKITKWLSLEGVIKGNIAASSTNLYNFINNFQKQSIDTKHMKYSWVYANLNEKSPYYKPIQIGFESSTKDDANEAALSFWMRLNGKFRANDGYQAVRDTFFETNATHTFFHDNHIKLAKNKAAWAYAASFLTSKKHVRITLIDATLYNLREDRIPFFNIKPADIVFQSAVYSQKAQDKWNFTRPIDERRLRGKYLPLYYYHDTNTAQTLNQTLFDSFILENEDTLTLDITPFELDYEPDYGVKEFTGHGDNESLGKVQLQLPMKSGIYPLQNNEWSGRVKVEVWGL